MSEEGQDRPAEQEAQPEPQQEEESRRARAMRYGHRGRLYLTLVLGIAAVVILILLIARNTRKVRLDYIVGHTNSALIWLIVISAIAGWVVGIVTAFLIRRRTRWRRMT